MKTAKLFGTLLILTMLATPLLAQSQVLHLSDLNSRTIQDFSQGQMGDFIVECPAGASLPFKLTLNGEFLSLDSTAPCYLNVMKTCYIRCEKKENFLFSTDRQNWKDFSEFFTGSLHVSVEAESRGPVAGLQLELNQKRN